MGVTSRRAFVSAAIVAVSSATTPARSADPPPTPRLVPAPGKPVGFQLRVESSSSASGRAIERDKPRESMLEMSYALEVGAADAAGNLAVGLRIARIVGVSTRMGFGSFDFDSEAAPPSDRMRLTDFFQFTALAGAEFGLRVKPDGAVVSVAGVDEARRLAKSRCGDDALASIKIDSVVSTESVRGLFLSLVGPAPFPAEPMSPRTSWSDTDSLSVNSWATTYEITRVLQATTVSKDAATVTGKGSAKLLQTSDVALIPLQMSRSVRSAVASEWTISTTDGLPLSGGETITLAGGIAAGNESLSSTHSCKLRITRTAAPPPPAVRPLAGAKDAAERKQKDASELLSRGAARRKERQAAGTRGAWGVSPDGAFVAAGTPSCDVEVWRVGEARPIAVLKGHSNLVAAVAVGSGGKWVGAVSEDGTAREWDVATGAETSALGKPYETETIDGAQVEVGYRSVTTSPDGRFDAYVGRSSVDVWDGTKKDGWLDPGPDTFFPHAAFFLKDSRRMLVAGMDELALYDLLKPPTSEPDPMDEKKRWVHRKATWERRTAGGLIGSSDPATSLGTGRWYTAAVLDGPSLVVTLVEPDSLESSRTPAKSALRAWDASTGAKRWEVAAEARAIVAARAAAWVVLADDNSLRFLSSADGKLVGTAPLPSKTHSAWILAPDATAWFDADRDGNLVRHPIESPARAPTGK